MPRPHVPDTSRAHRRHIADNGTVIRLYLIVFLALALLSWAAPWLRRLGLGRRPGDVRYRLLGRAWDLPVASTRVISLAVGLLARFL